MYVSGRVKAMNKDVMVNVDAIHNAISQNLKISFQYFQWNVKKEPELRKDGARYVISPWGLSWDDENYYLVGYDSEADMIKHYRVDKMLHIKVGAKIIGPKSLVKEVQDEIKRLAEQYNIHFVAIISI